MNAAHRTFIVIALLSAAGCEDKQHPIPAAAKAPASGPKPAAPLVGVAPPVAPAATGGSAISALGLSFTVPAGWKQVPPANAMRLAEVQVADPTGDAAKACIVAFSSAGGDVQANIDRWAGQVHDAAGASATPRITTSTVAGTKITIAEMTGSYAGMGEAAPHANWTLRGAILETPDGLLFIKMTGPAEQMAAAAAAFGGMIDGLQKK